MAYDLERSVQAEGSVRASRTRTALRREFPDMDPDIVAAAAALVQERTMSKRRASNAVLVGART